MSQRWTSIAPEQRSSVRGGAGIVQERDMAEAAELKVIRLVRELDAERRRRANAERSAKMAKSMNVRLRQRIRLLTSDAAATKGLPQTSES